MTQNTAVEVKSGVVPTVTGIAGVLLLLALTVVLFIGTVATGGQPDFGPGPLTVSQLDAGSFVTLANPLPTEVRVSAATDGGFDVTDRRDEFKLRMKVLAAEISLKLNDTVNVEKIYSSTAYSPSADAAIVVFRAEKLKESTALFFVFTNGTWKTFPADFQ